MHIVVNVEVPLAYINDHLIKANITPFSQDHENTHENTGLTNKYFVSFSIFQFEYEQ